MNSEPATGPVGFRERSYFLWAARNRFAAARNRANGYADFLRRYPGPCQQDSRFEGWSDLFAVPRSVARFGLIDRFLEPPEETGAG
jgi:hypothetical protein